MRAVIASLVLGGVLALVSMSFADEGKWDALLKQTEYPLGDAVAKALAFAKEGAVIEAEIETDEDKAVYSVDIAQGAKKLNVVLDAKTGEVVEKDLEDEDQSAIAKAFEKLTLAKAIETALAKHAGAKAVHAVFLVEAGKAVASVTVVVLGKEAVVRIDGATGEVLADGGAKPAVHDGFTDTFHVDPAEWSATGANPYFSLEPGHFIVMEGKDEGVLERVTITVLDETLTVDGVETRIVEEREEKDGKLIEVSRNYFAISKRSNSVYYFGEDVDMYKDGVVTGHGGSWRAGKDGARFGLAMSGTPLLGACYYQEIAPGVALDRAKIVGTNETLDTPAGKLVRCLKVEESTPLEKGREYKMYAPGIGMVQDADLLLVKHGMKK